MDTASKQPSQASSSKTSSEKKKPFEQKKGNVESEQAKGQEQPPPPQDFKSYFFDTTQFAGHLFKDLKTGGKQSDLPSFLAIPLRKVLKIKDNSCQVILFAHNLYLYGQEYHTPAESKLNLFSTKTKKFILIFFLEKFVEGLDVLHENVDKLKKKAEAAALQAKLSGYPVEPTTDESRVKQHLEKLPGRDLNWAEFDNHVLKMKEHGKQLDALRPEFPRPHPAERNTTIPGVPDPLTKDPVTGRTYTPEPPPEGSAPPPLIGTSDHNSGLFGFDSRFPPPENLVPTKVQRTSLEFKTEDRIIDDLSRNLKNYVEESMRKYLLLHVPFVEQRQKIRLEISGIEKDFVKTDDEYQFEMVITPRIGISVPRGLMPEPESEVEEEEEEEGE